MAVQKHNTYYDNELYYYDEHGVRKPLQVGKVYSAGSGIKIENDIISVSGKYVASADPSLDGKQLVLKDNKWEELVLPPSSDWLPTIKEASANAVSTVEGKFGLDEYNQITSYNNTPFANDKYHAGYGLDLDSSTNTFSAKKGFFALSADVDDKIETLKQEIAKLGFYVCNNEEIKGNDEPDESVLDNEGKLSTSKVYLVKVNTAPTPDQYKEWIWDGSVWTCIGDTTINLDGYATEDWVKGNFLSANALDFMTEASASWNEVSSKLNTSDFNAWSAQADISSYSGIDPIKVEDHKISLTANYLSANALDEINVASANWNSVYETVNTTSSDWNEVSSKANQTDLDELSGKVETLSGELKTTSAYLNEKIETLSGELESTSSFLSGAIDVVSAEFEKVIYTSASAGWDVTPYSAGQNINITNHTISSKDWTNEIKEASANAVDVVKGNFNKTQNGEFSGYDNTPFYVKQNTVSGTSPILVTKQGDEYNIEFEQEYKKFIEEVSAKLYTSALPTVSSVTPDYLKVEFVENQDGTSAWNLSAAEQKNYQAGDYIDIDENDKINVTGLHNVTLSSTDKSIGISATTGVNGDVNYNLSVDQVEVPNISGYNGIVASYNEETNQYEVGFKENDYSYLFGHYGNNSTVTDGTILKLDSNNYYKITIDEDGYITLPQTTNKFTFCINEYIDDNTTQNHEYLLNKLVLSAKGGDSIVTSQNYYPSEVGSSNVTLALTIDNSISPKEYCIVYKGSDVATNKLKIEASILEEVTSLDSSRGDVDDYTGREPIRIVQNSRIVELLYDEDVFSLKHNAELQADMLTIESQGGEVVNKETFDKLLNSINGRMTETIPFGALNTVSDIAGQYQYAYLFRPTIEYEMTKDTQAYMMGGNADTNEYVSVAVYQGVAGSSNLLWESGYTLIPTSGGQVVMDARVNSPSATISPDSLYYVCVRVDKLDEHGGTWHNVLGLSMGSNRTTDIGNPKPWVGQTNIPNLDYPSTQDFAGGSMSDFGGTKPYVGFRTKETNV